MSALHDHLTNTDSVYSGVAHSTRTDLSLPRVVVCWHATVSQSSGSIQLSCLETTRGVRANCSHEFKSKETSSTPAHRVENFSLATLGSVNWDVGK